MLAEQHYRKLENMYHNAPCNEYYGPNLTIGEGEARLVVPVKPAFFHSAGAVHGSVYFKLLDDAAFFAANSLVTDVFLLTVGFNVFFTRPVRTGELKSVGRVIHRSANLYLAESILYNGRDREVGRGRGSFMKSQIRLGPEIGYQ